MREEEQLISGSGLTKHAQSTNERLFQNLVIVLRLL